MPTFPKIAPPVRHVLWVDDEAELLEPHRLFLADKGFEVSVATNADDAVEMLRRGPFDLMLLDEQMPGKRGLEAYREVREIAPTLPVVMVTKSEEDSILREALGANVRDYLVKPVSPRQVLAAVTKILEGSKIRKQAVARAFVDRFREIEHERHGSLDWRGWIERFDELMRWDVDLAESGETGLYDSLRGLYPDLQREFAAYMQHFYPQWLANLEGERPPLSIDVVPEFVLPVLQRDRRVILIVVDCMRVDQWRIVEPTLASLFDVETTHYFAVLPTATPYSRNALFSGLFPGEIAARFPDWWGERDDETLNAHERDLLEAQMKELKLNIPVRYQKISTPHDSDELEKHMSTAIAAEGISAFVFNFVDLLTHGRSESAILFEVAKDEIALRQLTLQWFQRSALLSLAEGSGAQEGHRGAHQRPRLDPLHHAGHGLRQARRDAEPALQVRRGPARRAARAGAPLP